MATQRKALTRGAQTGVRISAKPSQEPRAIRVARTLPYEDYISAVFDRHVDLLGRTIFLTSVYVDTDGSESGTDASMYDYCAKALALLERLDPRKPITIETANFGGCLYHGLGIYDRIKASPCRIIMHGYGPVMSAGAFIFQAGDERLLAPNATMMIHYTEGSIESMRDQARESQIQEYNRVNKCLEDIYVSRIEQCGIGINIATLRRHLKNTLYLSAQQAVMMGLADSIIAKP